MYSLSLPDYFSNSYSFCLLYFLVSNTQIPGWGKSFNLSLSFLSCKHRNPAGETHREECVDTAAMDMTYSFLRTSLRFGKKVAKQESGLRH